MAEKVKVARQAALNAFCTLRHRLLASHAKIFDVLICGSVRRRKEMCGDLDVIAVDGTMPINESRIYRTAEAGIPAQVHFCHPANVGAMILFATGSAQFNICMRARAKRMGYCLNQYGLWKDDEEVSTNEDDILQHLGFGRFSDPAMREMKYGCT